MRCAHRPACRGQRFALPTAQAFAHKLHSLPPPSMKPEPQRLRSYRSDKYCDAGGRTVQVEHESRFELIDSPMGIPGIFAP